MTREEILNKAKYILVEAYDDVNPTINREIKENIPLVLDYLKDKQYLKIGCPDKRTRYNEVGNYHHYTTNFLYENLKSIMNFIGVKDFNFNDFVIRENINKNTNQDFSYLYYTKPINYKITTSYYTYDKETNIVRYDPGNDVIMCDYTFLTYAKYYNHISPSFGSNLTLNNYAKLNFMAHDVGIIENLSTKNDKTILISCDSHSIPLIPILSCYYKRVILLDSRFSGNNTRYYWENKEIDDVLIEISFNNKPEKFIKDNFE